MTFILRTNEVFSTKDNVNNVIILKKVPYLLERIQNVYPLPFICSFATSEPSGSISSGVSPPIWRPEGYEIFSLSLSSLRACTLPARAYQSRRHHGATRMIPSPQPNLGGLENRNEIFHSIFGWGVAEHQRKPE